MQGMITGFVILGIVITLGYLLAVFRVVDATAQAFLTRLAFFVVSPCMLFTVMASTDVAHVLSRPLLATVAGVAAAAVPYVLIARLVWNRRTDDVAIGTLCAAYCNAGNLGVPVAAYVLGDAALIAPMLLLNLVVLQPSALALLDARRTGRFSPLGMLRTATTNPLTIATGLGAVVAATGVALPAVVWEPVDLVGGMAVPAVLIAYGASLRLGPPPGRGAPPVELALIALLKHAVQPLGAYLAGRALGLPDPALLALAVTAALPTANNIFVIAARFGRQETLARDATFVTTLGAVPAIAVITVVLT